jgi:hypothetical protein
LVRRDGQFATEAEAIAAGNAYLTNNKASVIRKGDPTEVFTIMASRKANIIRPDPASHS